MVCAKERPVADAETQALWERGWTLAEGEQRLAAGEWVREQPERVLACRGDLAGGGDSSPVSHQYRECLRPAMGDFGKRKRVCAGAMSWRRRMRHLKCSRA